ncbi:MAG: tRNA (adenosine(37)-N6)-threonylcarbamoyltransferase complex transferase subunit TsaD [Alphaproteobacteria bacterium]|nr:tRNA (adenosine(37)-N6)-threonylcarbamoyltransferase complex transferase subunit TsaD [Alphaproteobacteria bacterium]
MIILGLETSCDETAAALVNDQGDILAHQVLSQFAFHQPFGGVVPEIAARSHIDHLDQIIKNILKESNIKPAQIDAVAATAGPGLIGGLLVGLTMAKSLALVWDKPLIAVNHLEAHALTARLTHKISFPYLLLLISGGHCQLLFVKGIGNYWCLGTTLDDALGEAFDKVAKLLNLDYPGGPALEKAARKARIRQSFNKFDLPQPMVGKDNCNFSFSGLKTAVRHLITSLIETQGLLSSEDQENIAASFEEAAFNSIIDRLKKAKAYLDKKEISFSTLVAAGGVAANQTLGQRLNDLGQEFGCSVIIPPPSLCTDNAAMVAWAGVERFKMGLSDSLDFAARPRWPLDPNYLGSRTKNSS